MGAWWEISIGGRTDFNWSLVLDWQRSGGCGPGDVLRWPGSKRVQFASVCSRNPMSARPTLLGIPDELFVKILSSLDFLQLVRSQSVRGFCHASAIRYGFEHAHRSASVSTMQSDLLENYSTSLNWVSVVWPTVHLNIHSTSSNGLTTSSPGDWSGVTPTSRKSTQYLHLPRHTCGNFVPLPSYGFPTVTRFFKVTLTS